MLSSVFSVSYYSSLFTLLFLFSAQVVAEQTPAVFVIVTVYTEVLPVGTVVRIVARVAVLMVDCKELLVLVVKLPCALGADQAVYL